MQTLQNIRLWKIVKSMYIYTIYTLHSKLTLHVLFHCVRCWCDNV